MSAWHGRYHRGAVAERKRIRALMDEHHENADCDIAWLADLLETP